MFWWAPTRCMALFSASSVSGCFTTSAHNSFNRFKRRRNGSISEVSKSRVSGRFSKSRMEESMVNSVFAHHRTMRPIKKMASSSRFIVV